MGFVPYSSSGTDCRTSALGSFIHPRSPAPNFYSAFFLELVGIIDVIALTHHQVSSYHTLSRCQ
ncbi:ORF1225 [White spot syndrome virus]|uniref:ORF1225 n=1 Tax=White spot syndrome virus TaxID=342409 RepID=A0A2D3I6Y9_9VIRU|nr:ORF1225 [White spot syndrome virus]